MESWRSAENGDPRVHHSIAGLILRALLLVLDKAPPAENEQVEGIEIALSTCELLRPLGPSPVRDRNS